MIGWWSMMVGCRGDETWALGREDEAKRCIRKNTLSLEHPRKYPKGCPNTT